MTMVCDRLRWTKDEDAVIARAYGEAARTRVQVRPEDLDLPGRSGAEIVRRAMALRLWRPLPRLPHANVANLEREESDAARQRAVSAWLAKPLQFTDAENDAAWSPPAARIA